MHRAGAGSRRVLLHGGSAADLRRRPQAPLEPCNCSTVDAVDPGRPMCNLQRERVVLAIGLVAGAGVLITGFAAGGFAGRLAGAGIAVAPLLILGWLAHLGVRRFWARALSWAG